MSQQDVDFDLDASSIKLQQLAAGTFKSLVLAGLNIIGIFYASKNILGSYSSLLVRLLVFIILFSPPLYLFLSTFTELVEDIRRRRCNLDAWNILEKDVYDGAKVLEVRPDRRLCVAEIAKGQATAGTTILFVHGSMARLSQFAEQLTYFSARGYRVVVNTFEPKFALRLFCGLRAHHACQPSISLYLPHIPHHITPPIFCSKTRIVSISLLCR